MRRVFIGPTVALIVVVALAAAVPFFLRNREGDTPSRADGEASHPETSRAAVHEAVGTEKDESRTPAEETPKAESQEEAEPAAEAGTDERAAPAEAWAVQVSAFPTAEEASRLAAALEGHGYRPYIVRASVHGSIWYRVRLGFYATDREAAAAGEQAIREAALELDDYWAVLLKGRDLEAERLFAGAESHRVTPN